LRSQLNAAKDANRGAEWRRVQYRQQVERALEAACEQFADAEAAASATQRLIADEQKSHQATMRRLAEGGDGHQIEMDGRSPLSIAPRGSPAREYQEMNASGQALANIVWAGLQEQFADAEHHHEVALMRLRASIEPVRFQSSSGSRSPGHSASPPRSSAENGGFIMDGDTFVSPRSPGSPASPRWAVLSPGDPGNLGTSPLSERRRSHADSHRSPPGRFQEAVPNATWRGRAPSSSASAGSYSAGERHHT